jgi:hypothetical protein
VTDMMALVLRREKYDESARAAGALNRTGGRTSA